MSTDIHHVSIDYNIFNSITYVLPLANFSLILIYSNESNDLYEKFILTLR